MKKQIAEADPPKENSMFERMNGRPQLLFSSPLFIEWITPSGKKIFYPSSKFDALNRSF